MPCQYNDPSAFDPEKKIAYKEIKTLRKSLEKMKESLKKPPSGRHPYDIAVDIQSIQEDIKLLMLELRPHVVT